MPLDDRAIALSATFTAEALQPGLAFWAGELGLDHEIRFAAYNQLFQELLDPAGLFARNRAGINVALVRLEDWAEAGIRDSAERFLEAVRSFAATSPAPLVVAMCPSRSNQQARETALLQALEGIGSVHAIASEQVLARYAVREVHDPHADELGHLPYTPEFFMALATAVARKIHALTAPPFKVVALDCDDTLWAGICGEDGPRNVVLDPPRRYLHEFMAARRREGMLLTLCSKNNEEDVFETFDAHSEFPLRVEDFAALRLNWDSKAVNLAALANELDLGLDSFILVDDNPKECSEVQTSTPSVVALPLPKDASDIPAFLDHVWAFDRARITEEDRRRPELYAQRAERTRAERSAGSLEEFLASLNLEVRIAPMKPTEAARVAQLTQRTNQMNATSVRRSEAEILALADAECLTVDVKDRFGSYGLTGVMIFREDGRRDALAVDTFLLSCRALGRGVEHRMMAQLGEIAGQRGLKHVEVPFARTPRNRPAELFLNSLTAPDAGGRYRLSAAQAAEAKFTPAARPEVVAHSPEEQTAAPAFRPNYLLIATELRDPEAILARIRAADERPAPPVATLDPPRTALERELAELWAALLNLPAVGVHDNFFELGGHSLLAVQLLSRVRQIHGVELSLEVVYSGDFTVAELAKAVELKEIEQTGADYQDLMRELEGLSDEEVRALLAQEQEAD